MKKPLTQFFTILLIVFSCGKKEYADTIIFGGTIYTVDSLNSKTESVAIKDGIIAFLFIADGKDFQDILNKSNTYIKISLKNIHTAKNGLQNSCEKRINL